MWPRQDRTRTTVHARRSGSEERTHTVRLVPPSRDRGRRGLGLDPPFPRQCLRWRRPEAGLSVVGSSPVSLTIGFAISGTIGVAVLDAAGHGSAQVRFQAAKISSLGQ